MKTFELRAEIAESTAVLAALEHDLIAVFDTPEVNHEWVSEARRERNTLHDRIEYLRSLLHVREWTARIGDPPEIHTGRNATDVATIDKEI